MRVAVLVLALAVSGACLDTDDNRIEVLVDALVAESGSLATKAEDELVARGRESIVILETGLYRAEPEQRRRIIRTLTRIGDPDVVPILDHLHAHDADPEVREAAERALARLNRRPGSESKGRD